MPASKKLNTVATDNQRKIIDLTLSQKHLKPQKARKSLDDKKSDEKAPEKRDFSHDGFNYFFQVINISV